MTYRVVFHAKADAETIGLPAEAFTALIHALAAVSREPLDPATTLATADPHVRRATFATFGLCCHNLAQALKSRSWTTFWPFIEVKHGVPVGVPRRHRSRLRKDQDRCQGSREKVLTWPPTRLA